MDDSAEKLPLLKRPGVKRAERGHTSGRSRPQRHPQSPRHTHRRVHASEKAIFLSRAPPSPQTSLLEFPLLFLFVSFSFLECFKEATLKAVKKPKLQEKMSIYGIIRRGGGPPRRELGLLDEVLGEFLQ